MRVLILIYFLKVTVNMLKDYYMRMWNGIDHHVSCLPISLEIKLDKKKSIKQCSSLAKSNNNTL